MKRREGQDGHLKFQVSSNSFSVIILHRCLRGLNSPCMKSIPLGKENMKEKKVLHEVKNLERK